VVEERYGIRSLEVRRRLTGGYANDLLLAEAEGRQLVIRVVRRPVDLAGLEWEAGVTRALAAEVPEVVAPVPALDGSSAVALGADAVLVLPYVDAMPADRDDPRQRAAAAALLGRFHAAARNLDVGQRPGAVRLAQLRPRLADGSYYAAIGPTAKPWPPQLEARRGEIDAARRWMLAFVERVARERTPAETVVHGDYFRGNVLCRGGEAIGLVDFEDMRLDWAVADLAGAAWEFCKAGDCETFDRAEAHAFIQAYRAAGAATPSADDDLIVPLIRVRRVLELVRAPYDRRVDWEYQIANLDAFERLG
jgi:Ser/Thr protein kinase RdoA (MazF antagonist)